MTRAGRFHFKASMLCVDPDHIGGKLTVATSAEMMSQAVRYVETAQLGGE